MYRIVCVASGLVIAAGTFGCTPKNDPAPATTSVAGVVNLDSKPMAEGEIRFSVSGQPPKTMPIKEGKFTGEAFVGKNQVEVVLEKKGPPSTTDPNVFTTVNMIAPKYTGPTSSLNTDIPKSGANDLKFDVTSVPNAK